MSRLLEQQARLADPVFTQDPALRPQRFVEFLTGEAPEAIRDGYVRAKAQAARVREIIRAYWRHPHRNAILGRVATVKELPYLEKGEFPHERPVRLDEIGDA